MCVKPGIKHDTGKVRLDLVPPEAIMAIGEIMTHGAKRYGDNSWQNVESQRYYAALLRHLMAWKKGHLRDCESGMPHMWHVLTNAAFLVALEEERAEYIIPPGEYGDGF